MKLTKKQVSFLRDIHNNKDNNRSVTEIGSAYFKCNAFVYQLLLKFSSEGILNLEKGKKLLVVTLTPKGIELIQ
jgi:hypothetical protein